MMVAKAPINGETKMTAKNLLPANQKYVPSMGKMTAQSPLAYKATRLVAGALNVAQMGLAEA